MSILFTKLIDSYAILQSNGVFKQAALHERNGELYAAASGGFIRVGDEGGTSVTRVRHTDLIIDSQYSTAKDKLGRMTIRRIGD